MITKKDLFVFFAVCAFPLNGFPQSSKAILTSREDNPVIEIEKKDESIVNEYLKIHKEFFNDVCTPGTEPKFWDLLKDHNGFGHYVPQTLDNELDEATVNRFIPEIQAKVEWLNKQISYVKKLSKKDFQKQRNAIDKLQKGIDSLLEEKKEAFLGKSKKQRKKARIRSQYKLVEYRHHWEKFLKKIPFLLSFNFPVDHFDLRLSYDRFKNSKNAKKKKKANEIFFYRKIVQDGALNKDRGRSDGFLRAALDTITLKLRESHKILPDGIRYDLEYVLPKLDKHLAMGKRNMIDRLTDWRDRVKEALNFYKSLKENKVKVDDHYETRSELISTLSKARHELKTFSLKKRAETYNYWKDERELMRALFALETILYNEVGGLDGKEGIERLDVAQVVINRTRLQRYSSIVPAEPLHQYLAEHDKLLTKYSWLNTLFKKGEFSFTYFFIHGNIRIYCPAMTRNGKFLRRQNLDIALERLREPNFDFEAIRYFSRRSMLGRINMAKIWSGFEPIAERPGPEIEDDKVLKNQYKDDMFQFLYRFSSPEGEVYHVLRMSDETEYVYHPASKSFYEYRNPYFFRYFRPIEKNKEKRESS